VLKKIKGLICIRNQAHNLTLFSLSLSLLVPILSSQACGKYLLKLVSILLKKSLEDPCC
jgi:hypothetical protein